MKLTGKMAYPFNSSMHTPNMHGLLEQPNEVAALPLIIQNNVITQQLINTEWDNLTRSRRRRGSLVAIVLHLLLL
jgi:hypothetical protein